MKKIALTLVAVSALGLAACDRGTEANTAADNGAAENEAVEDVNASEAAQNALDAAGNAIDQAGESVENAADATAEAAENATK